MTAQSAQAHNQATIEVTIDGIKVAAQEGMTIIQACALAGKEIPRFCYHERLEIAGNCRMCLVTVEKMPKPVASCAQPVTNGMIVHTNTPTVKKAREGVMEFLLINHPLDCPICDQGGECDLQDQALLYGKGYSRYQEEKRSVDYKEMGPLIETSMNRCIHCTRCVRFIEDIAGTTELGAVGRGEEMEITPLLNDGIKSELSGNIIDLCPVGALTSKPNAFEARAWEYKKTPSIDVMDAVGSNIRIDSKGKQVMRILPRLNEDINEEWISDKTRFACDGLKYQRLDRPLLKNASKFQEISWAEALKTAATKIKETDPSCIGSIAGDLTDVETMTIAKAIFDKLAVKSYDCRQDGSLISNEHRGLYILNTSIAKSEEADFVLLVGTNPRHDAALLNARFRKAYLKNNAQFAVIGEKIDLNYPNKHLGTTPWILKQIADGSHPISSALASAKKPMIVIGASAMAREDWEGFLYYGKKIATKYNLIKDGWNGFNVLQTAASRVGGLDIGFIPQAGGLTTNQMLGDKMKVLILLGADEIDTSKISKDTFVIYIGHHGDKGATRANLILPAAAYTEKDATYVNLEGRAQNAYMAVSPIGDALPDYEIFLKLAKALNIDLQMKRICDIRNAMRQAHNSFKQMNAINSEQVPLEIGKLREFGNEDLTLSTPNFYMTNTISRNSKTMAECTRAAKNEN